MECRNEIKESSQHNTISENPYDRVTAEMKALLSAKECRFDVHCHLFNFRDVPDKFLGIRFPFNERFLAWMERKLHRIIRHRDNDVFSNLAYFINVFNTRSPEETFVKLAGYYPGENTIFCPLMMDISPGIKGNTLNSYNDQLDYMLMVRNKFPASILPFFAADPNNPDMKTNFIKTFAQDNKYRFFGVKVYPSLGYLPSHPDLMEIFSVCEAKNIPVTAHCSGAVIHSSKRFINHIPGLHYSPEQGFIENKKSVYFNSKTYYADFFNHPRNWIPVLNNFPKLKLNLAHFGGGSEWRKYLKGKGDNWVSRIIDLMERFENLYSDFSYTFYNKQLHESLRNMIINNKLLSDRVLYGSDYYLVVKEGFFRTLRVNFQTAMGDEIMRKIAIENPRRFLFGS